MPASNFKLTATTTDMTTKLRFMRIEINTGQCDIIVELPLAIQFKPCALRDVLVNKGARMTGFKSNIVDTVKKQIVNKLDTVPELEVYKQPGHKADGSFVMPRKTYSIDEIPLSVFDARSSDDHDLLPCGRFDKWKEMVGEITCRSNYAIMAIALALTGPVMEPIGEDESILFNFWGATSMGKSSLVVLATSVFSKASKSKLFNFDHSNRGAEEQFASHNHLFLAIDELGSANSKTETKEGLRKKSMSIASGAGTVRSKAVDEQLPNLNWLLTAASTGNRPVVCGLQTGDDLDPTAVRWLDIRVHNYRSCGFLDKIKGDANVRDNRLLIRRVLLGLKTNHGTVGRRWISHLVRNKAKAIKTIESLRGEFVTNHVHDEKSEEGRIGEKFALISAVAQYAASKGLVPWTKEEGKKSCAIIYSRYLKDFGKSPAAHLKAITTLTEMIAQQDGLPAYKKEKWDALSSQPKAMTFGFVKKDSKGRPRLYLFPATLNALSTKLGLKESELKSMMRGYDLFVADAQKKLTQAIVLPWQLAKMRLHIINVAALIKFVKSQSQ
jgi:uncharacterized protein (DUF927 family)